MEPVTATAPLVSGLADHLIGSEIIRIAGEINHRIAQGERIHNLTIGDFDPAVFPLPTRFRELIQHAYAEGLSNYPPANGVLDLRKAVSAFLQRGLRLEYGPDDILIAGGARPLIYAAYKAVVNPGERVVYPVPSWNNNHYTYLHRAEKVEVATTPANRFLPTADELRPHLPGAALLALCSPLNPTGTSFSADQLAAICDLVLEENARRKGAKPLYVMYDQIYHELVLGGTAHVDPVSLRPEMRPYTIYIDGISKSLAATGVRVGWGFGPSVVMRKMAAILGHVGAWAPKPEQVATARYLAEPAYGDAVQEHRRMVAERVEAYHKGFQELKAAGYPVDSIPAQGAIYLSVRIGIIGRDTPEGKPIKDAFDATWYLIQHAGMGIVPFFAFGTGRDNDWFRISVGTTRMEMVPEVIGNLRKAMDALGEVR
jgi:aspartate aminotransferase